MALVYGCAIVICKTLEGYSGFRNPAKNFWDWQAGRAGGVSQNRRSNTADLGEHADHGVGYIGKVSNHCQRFRPAKCRHPGRGMGQH